MDGIPISRLNSHSSFHIRFTMNNHGLPRLKIHSTIGIGSRLLKYKYEPRLRAVDNGQTTVK